jgi:hypothetical protein
MLGQCRSRSASAGAELRRPLGITIVGGLFVSQVLTLFRPHAIEQLIEKVRFAGASPLEEPDPNSRFPSRSGCGFKPSLGPARRSVPLSYGSARHHRANTRWTSW